MTWMETINQLEGDAKELWNKLIDQDIIHELDYYFDYNIYFDDFSNSWCMIQQLLCEYIEWYELNQDYTPWN